MKNLISFALFAMLLSGCKQDHSTMPMLDITHPAAYVVNGESNSLSVIDLTDNTVKHEIKLGEAGHNMTGGGFSYPHHISLNKAKTKLSIGVPNMDLSVGHTTGSMEMKGNIVIVDARTGEILKVLDLPKSNHNAIFSPDDTEIWTSQMEMNGKVLVYDANTYTLKNTISVGMMPAEVTFSYDGKTAFVSNGDDNTVSAINVSTKTVIKTIAVGANPVGAWTGADNRNYVDNEDGKSVSIIDQNLNVVSTINLGFTPDYAAYIPTSQEVWVTSGTENKIFVYQLQSGVYTKTNEISMNAGTHAIAFSQDYKTAYITNQKSASVTVFNVETKTKIKDLTVGKNPNGIVMKF